jgi:outer membrane protein assembly factor BamD (BamD/ComL family)
MYYLRRKAYDSGIIYFRDVVAKYPSTPTAKDAQLRLVDSYRAIKYKEDAQDACAALRKNYPADKQVEEACKGITTPSTTVATPESAPPSSTGPPAASPVPATPPTT